MLTQRLVVPSSPDKTENRGSKRHETDWLLDGSRSLQSKLSLVHSHEVPNGPPLHLYVSYITRRGLIIGCALSRRYKMVPMKSKLLSSAFGCFDLTLGTPLMAVLASKDGRLRFVTRSANSLWRHGAGLLDTQLPQKLSHSLSTETQERDNQPQSSFSTYHYRPLAYPGGVPNAATMKDIGPISMITCGPRKDILLFSCPTLTNSLQSLRLPSLSQDAYGRVHLPAWTAEWKPVQLLSEEGIAWPTPKGYSKTTFHPVHVELSLPMGGRDRQGAYCLAALSRRSVRGKDSKSEAMKSPFLMFLVHPESNHAYPLSLRDSEPSATAVTSIAFSFIDPVLLPGIASDRTYALMAYAEGQGTEHSIVLRYLSGANSNLPPVTQNGAPVRLFIPRLKGLKDGTVLKQKTDAGVGVSSTSSTSSSGQTGTSITSILILAKNNILIASNSGDLYCIQQNQRSVLEDGSLLDWADLKGHEYTIRSLLPRSLVPFIRSQKCYDSCEITLQPSSGPSTRDRVLVNMVTSNGLIIHLLYSLMVDTENAIQFEGVISNQTLPGRVETTDEPTGQGHASVAVTTNAHQLLLLPLTKTILPQTSFVHGCALLLWRGIKECGGVTNLAPHPTIRGLTAVGLKNGSIGILMERFHERAQSSSMTNAACHKKAGDRKTAESSLEVPLVYWDIFNRDGFSIGLENSKTKCAKVEDARPSICPETLQQDYLQVHSKSTALDPSNLLEQVISPVHGMGLRRVEWVVSRRSDWQEVVAHRATSGTMEVSSTSGLPVQPVQSLKLAAHENKVHPYGTAISRYDAMQVLSHEASDGMLSSLMAVYRTGPSELYHLSTAVASCVHAQATSTAVPPIVRLSHERLHIGLNEPSHSGSAPTYGILNCTAFPVPKLSLTNITSIQKPMDERSQLRPALVVEIRDYEDEDEMTSDEEFEVGPNYGSAASYAMASTDLAVSAASVRFEPNHQVVTCRLHLPKGVRSGPSTIENATTVAEVVGQQAIVMALDDHDVTLCGGPKEGRIEDHHSLLHPSFPMLGGARRVGVFVPLSNGEILSSVIREYVLEGVVYWEATEWHSWLPPFTKGSDLVPVPNSLRIWKYPISGSGLLAGFIGSNKQGGELHMAVFDVVKMRWMHQLPTPMAIDHNNTNSFSFQSVFNGGVQTELCSWGSIIDDYKNKATKVDSSKSNIITISFGGEALWECVVDITKQMVPISYITEMPEEEEDSEFSAEAEGKKNGGAMEGLYGGYQPFHVLHNDLEDSCVELELLPPELKKFILDERKEKSKLMKNKK